MDPNLRPSELDDVDGYTWDDVPGDCDREINPKGDRRRQTENKVYVVWEGRERGLFWCW